LQPQLEFGLEWNVYVIFSDSRNLLFKQLSFPGLAWLVRQGLGKRQRP
jgi:hypothetical protein